nr:MAG TPA: hypothetical protein [Bacteriophage sp.]DAR35210.1 MAG TPA: hypothetical protein [Caudoviricetes sp.]DAU55767.1 MAG TPA: hypothetical protein [Crassvirales sp.]DAX20402.1 MAG TPA: hypothetical protein [Caudoviricetes sp.]DAX79767.1 MAG TPA: hypothetical protein [Caudoviricetes sp.]
MTNRALRIRILVLSQIQLAQISRVNADFLSPKFFYGRLRCY